MKIIPGNAQHIGTRKEQQDDFGFSDLEDNTFVAHGGVFAVLADGMGGHKMGSQASRTAVRVMRKAYEAKTSSESISDALKRSLDEANQAVFKMADESGFSGDAGTTLVAAVIHKNFLYWISVGDSHIYLIRKSDITQLNTDHVYSRELAKQVSKGRINQEEADTHPDRNALTSSIGESKINLIDKNNTPYPLESEDWVLLCSDGLYKTLSEKEIARTMAGTPQRVAETLVEKACLKKRTNQDNITTVILALSNDNVSKETKASHRSFLFISASKFLILIFLLVLLGFLIQSNKDDLKTLFRPEQNITQLKKPVKQINNSVVTPHNKENKPLPLQD
jgi:PPM family protein phosphatase